ncbi:hypothetical protein [Aeromicrobium terrae]|uniref:Gram-positive cocci surface proteins LPxTG domain-containing protein n=1 Tax=Aeromicrobium terrae TaxID=2498846 RepID=A0A5C8NHD5_9ACTN|nr:hypothetical protein [Aeromicrobium terrae]TXL61219.1 hypothetical protein FHP06_07210 [Aeromicrobium terrae]
MNSTITKLAIAAPLATIGLALVPAAAMAEVPGPVVIGQPAPGPQDGPKDKAPVPQPGPQDGPKDKAPVPQPGPQDGPDDKDGPKTDPVDPDGPGGVITNPQPCPTHGVDCDGKDDPEDGDEPTGEDRDDVGTVSLPKRIDAGEASATEQGDDLELGWLIAGGALVTASGAALAVRARRRTA